MKHKWMFLLFVMMVMLLPAAGFAGSISGKANFTGTAPAPEKISMDADPTCMSFHSEPVMNPEVTVNSNNTLKNVFVYVKEGLEGKTFEAPAEKFSLDQKGCTYTPRVFGIQIGQGLEIINSDSTLHNVHGMPAQSKEFNIGMPIQGMKLTRKFDAPEVMVKFKCDVHPWMRAYAGVLTHPYFSVTGEDGSYKIENLPAGTYVVEAWHEKFGVQTQSLTVDEAGAQTADFGFAG